MIPRIHRRSFSALLALALVLALPVAAPAQEFTDDFQCNSWCTTGTNNYFPLWPGYALVLEGIEEDEGELIEISS